MKKEIAPSIPQSLKVKLRDDLLFFSKARLTFLKGELGQSTM
jgi:hypothetical protein